MTCAMMLILILEAISNSSAVIRHEFRKLHFQMIDDTTCQVPDTHTLRGWRKWCDLCKTPFHRLLVIPANRKFQSKPSRGARTPALH